MLDMVVCGMCSADEMMNPRSRSTDDFPNLVFPTNSPKQDHKVSTGCILSDVYQYFRS
jgi:hypothetical protein